MHGCFSIIGGSAPWLPLKSTPMLPGDFLNHILSFCPLLPPIIYSPSYSSTSLLPPFSTASVSASSFPYIFHRSSSLPSLPISFILFILLPMIELSVHFSTPLDSSQKLVYMCIFF